MSVFFYLDLKIRYSLKYIILMPQLKLFMNFKALIRFSDQEIMALIS